MMCAKSWQTPWRFWNASDSGVEITVAFGIVAELGADAVHQLGRAGEHGAAGRETFARVVRRRQIVGDETARVQVVRGSVAVERARGEGGVAHVFPPRRRHP